MKNTTVAIAVAIAAASMAVTQVGFAKTTDYQGTVDLREATGSVKEIRGRVCEDLNRDSVCQSSEPGIKGVLVSDGLNVVETDRRGRYGLPLPSDEDEERGIAIFVTEPAGYDVPVDANNVPQFYYIHKPDGSPLGIYGEEFRFGGLEPTGPLPRAINFPMVYSGKKGKFKVAISGDTQPYSNTEVGYVRDTIAKEWATMPDLEAVIIEGDVLGDDLSLYPRFKEIIGVAKAPQYYVPGNHDLDFDAPSDDHSFDTFRREWGPEYYSFDIGEVHFIVLDDVKYPCLDEDNLDGLHGGCDDDILSGATYNGVITERQIQWIKNDLEHVDEDKLVVLNMHIPIYSFIDQNFARQMVDNVVDLYEAVGCELEEDDYESYGRRDDEDDDDYGKCERPLLALSGHTHTNEQIRPGEVFEGWNTTLSSGGVWTSGGPAPFPQIVAGAACGSWWSGDFNANVVPEAYQRLGAPRGFFLLEFDGNTYKDVFKATGQAAEKQMSLSMQTPEFNAWYEALLDYARNANVEDTPPVNINDLPDPKIVLTGEIAETQLVANVWNGSKESKVYVSFDGSDPIEMMRVQAGDGEDIIEGVEALDPFALARQLQVARYAFRSLSGEPRAQGFELFRGSTFGPGDPQPLSEFFLTDQSQHVWKVPLPEDLEQGMHIAKVVTEDHNGSRFEESLAFEILDADERPPKYFREELFEVTP